MDHKLNRMRFFLFRNSLRADATDIKVGRISIERGKATFQRPQPETPSIYFIAETESWFNPEKSSTLLNCKTGDLWGI